MALEVLGDVGAVAVLVHRLDDRRARSALGVFEMRVDVVDVHERHVREAGPAHVVLAGANRISAPLPMWNSIQCASSPIRPEQGRFEPERARRASGQR